MEFGNCAQEVWGREYDEADVESEQDVETHVDGNLAAAAAARQVSGPRVPHQHMEKSMN